MKVLIVFGTTEGHTRALCQFVARTLRERGHTATVESAREDTSHPDPSRYDLVFLAASLHVGRYQAVLAAYARAHADLLNRKASAFISVSLSAAGHNPDDWEGLEECLEKFEQETGWRPQSVHHAAGAILYSQYDFFKRLTLKHIVAARGQKTVTSRDYDLTDYDALREFTLGVADRAERQPAPTAPS